MSTDTDNATAAGSPRSVVSPQALGQVIQIDQHLVQQHLGEIVRSTVEQTLNAMLEAEADQLCGAKRYERNRDRVV